MKSLSKVLAIVLFISFTGCSTWTLKSTRNMDHVRRGYLYALESENGEVRNNAIFFVLKFKIEYPEENIEPLVKKLHQMSKNDPELLNRLHAYLTLICLERPELLASINPCDFEISLDFYNNLSNSLSQSGYGYEIRYGGKRNKLATK